MFDSKAILALLICCVLAPKLYPLIEEAMYGEERIQKMVTTMNNGGTITCSNEKGSHTVDSSWENKGGYLYKCNTLYNIHNDCHSVR